MSAVLRGPRRIMPKKNKTTIFLTICFAISIQSVYAAAIPAGTTLFVQTNETIASTDPVGRSSLPSFTGTSS